MRKFNERIFDLVDKGLEGKGLSDEEMSELYAVDPDSPEARYVQWGGRELQMRISDGKAEIHAQIGLNASMCGHNCKFCSFAAKSGVRHETYELSREDVMEYAKIYQEEGANLLLMLATATYRFEKVLDMVGAVREVVDPKMPLLVNIDDMTLEQTKALKAAGADGAYHAVRMREGVDTGIPIERRLETIANLQAAHMSISTCVEPIGPEHTPEELTEMSRLTMGWGAESAGCGRRINVPGTPVYERGMINDIQVALYVAVYRLAAGVEPRLNCAMSGTGSAMSGANLSWAEVGTNPRDTVERTEKGGRGSSIEHNRKMFEAGGWEVLDGFSQGWQLD